ncbi:MAG: methyltransferase domain-containing protein [Bacteroidia bacterium]|nr:methyltransferase domain-containing protein [Bacteroidia bacterium]
MRLIQHKKEAYWFYWYLSNFYDKLVNPLFWTPRMRDQSLELAQFDRPDLTVIDVGSGTGFTTQGIVEHITPAQVTCVDQSPHQMAKARKKPDLQGCTFLLGDAENIPFPADHFDRYVSAGSIEYWPDPQQGIAEAYRVIKPGGVAVLMGPLEPENAVSRWAANTWMLFPKDQEYRDWFAKAGFTDIQVRYVRPQWYTSQVEYGLAIAGRKPQPGASPAARTQPVAAPADERMTLGRWLKLIWRVLAGSTAGFIFIPGALLGYLKQAFAPKQDIPEKYRERLNGYQVAVLLLIAAIVTGIIWWIIK